MKKSTISRISVINVTFVEAHRFLTKVIQESLLLGYELEYIIFEESVVRDTAVVGQPLLVVQVVVSVKAVFGLCWGVLPVGFQFETT